MLPFTTRLIVLIVVVSRVSVKNSLAYTTHVCLTWEVRKENITFKCKVSHLKYRVLFYNPANKEEGHCLTPIPFPACYSSSIHNTISQDLLTNTSILVVHRHIDSSFNGPWTCYHGTKRDKAVVNVTILNTEQISNNDNCVEEYIAWTFIGVMISVIISFILWNVFKMLIGKRMINSDKKLYNLCGRLKCQSDSHCNNGYVKICTFLTISISAIFIPLISGLLATDCKGKNSFLLIGALLVLILMLLHRKDIRNIRYSPAHIGKKQPTHGDRFGFSKQHTQTDGDRFGFSQQHSQTALDGDQFGFSQQHSQTGEARFSAFDPDIHFDRRIRSIPNTRAGQMRLEEDGDQYGFSEQYIKTGDDRLNTSKLTPEADGDQYGFSEQYIKTDEDRLEFLAGQRFRLHPRCSYADSGISSISNTRSHQMQLDKETSFIVLENPYKSITEVVEPRNIGDSTSYYTQAASRSSPPETTLLLDCESSRTILENHNSCNILGIQSSDA